jgi:putative membrane-bound dehydrogenase-like protein
MKSPRPLLIVSVALCLLIVARAEIPKSPLAPADGLRHFQLAPGFRIELVAAEPQVVDPIEVRFDARGRLWVVEMRDYPNAGTEGEAPVSRIRLLEDRDGDGSFEDARTFADGLRFATGLQPWRDGVLVTVSGQLLFLEDTDDDGVADLREVWYRGFAENNPQLRANHPRLGLDNRIYVNGGLQGGTIVDVRRPGAAGVSIDGRDFCFDPLTGEYEAVSGNGQYGMTFDSSGNRFVCNNRHPMVHAVLEDRFLRRNSLFAPLAVVNDVARAGAASRVFPISRAWTTSVLHAHQFTAACGLVVYRDDALGSDFQGNAFVCEPTGNLVHREVVSADGVSFVSRRAREGVEFLATEDEWFRPVNLTIGPDGWLYVVDMYRAVIEHPQWLPPEEQDRPNFRHGDNRGRIYRIVRVDAGQNATVNLHGTTSQDLVNSLEHDRSWYRETAARLLLERGDRTVQKSLQRMARTSARVFARIQALWTLSGLQVLDDETLLAALGDGHPRVREQAVRLATSRLSRSAKLKQSVVALVMDADQRVRFQAALALGELPGDGVAESLARLAFDDSGEVWMRRALGTMLPSHVSSVLLRVLVLARESAAKDHEGLRDLVRDLAAIVGAGQQDAELLAVLAAVVDAAGDPASIPLRQEGLIGLAQGIAKGSASLLEFLERVASDHADLVRAVSEVFVRNAKDAVRHDLSEPARRRAINLLRHAPTEVALDPLLELAAKESLASMRSRAIDTLAAHSDPRIGPALLRDFPSETPEMRRRILDVLLASTEGADLLLNEIASGRIAPTEIDLVRAQRLLEHSDSEVRSKSQSLLGAPRPGRDELVLSYRPALELEGVPGRGRQIFVKRCATCHKIGDLGVDVGPQIEDSRTKTRDQLFIDILDPNRAMDARYLNYSAVTRSGEVYAGIVTAETSASITLRQPEAKTVTLLRTQLLEFSTSGQSLMPEGLEQDLSHQDLADLLTYIKKWRYLGARD